MPPKEDFLRVAADLSLGLSGRLNGGPAAKWRDVRRLLVVRMDNIGDMVMLTPALRALRASLPQARITLMASESGSRAAPLLPWVDEVIALRASWQELTPDRQFSRDTERETLRRVEEGSFDAAIIFTSFSQSPYPPAYVCMLAGVPLRAGQSREFGGALLTDWVKPPPDDTHQVDRNLWLLQELGFVPAGREMELRLQPEVRAAAGSILSEHGIDPDAPFLALVPGAGCQARSYPVDLFLDAARALTTETGWPVAVLGTAGERERWEASVAPSARRGVVSLLGRTTVPEFAAIIERSRGVLCSHSSAMHIADAFERPMVVLFSGTDLEAQWQPRRAPHRLLREPTACSPCYGITCPYHLECLDIPPATVVRHTLDLLQVAGGPGRALGLVETAIGSPIPRD